MSSLSSAVEVLDHVASELTYLPTPDQRRAKGAFWARFAENPICEPEEISTSIALRFAGDGRITKWWSHEGFRDWFRNRDEFRQRMEYLSHLALDSLEQILIDPKAQPSARVNAAKLIMEVSKKMPSKQAVEAYLDEKVAQMNKAQLEEYIKKSTQVLNLNQKLAPVPVQENNSLTPPSP